MGADHSSPTDAMRKAMPVTTLATDPLLPVGRPRNHHLDNARWLCVMLVVLGHLLEAAIWKSPHLLVVYRAIYLIHIPYLILLSGAVCRPTLDAHAAAGIVGKLLVPLAVLQLLAWWLGQFAWWGGPHVTHLTQPWWLLWYLGALAAWRLLLPLFDRMHPLARWGVALSLAVAAGFSSTLGPTTIRVMVFLPIFLVGYYFYPTLERLSHRVTVRLVALATLAVIVGFMASHNRFDVHWLYGNTTYIWMKADGIEAVILRLLQLGTATVGASAILMLLPHRRTVVSTSGAHSMGAYIAHGFVLKLLPASAGAMLLVPHWALALTALTVVAMLATTLLSTRMIATLVAMPWLSHWLLRTGVARQQPSP